MSSIPQTRQGVSIIGVGAIGSKVADVLLASGFAVTLWNRTSDRVDPLVARGAARAESAAQAAAASPLVMLCLTDYAAVGQVLDAISSVVQDRAVVTLTTGSPDEARHVAQRTDQAGATYLDGGVQTTPEDIGTNAATFLYSGSRAVFDTHRTVLETVGSARFLGTDPGAAAVQDLALFGLWYDAQIGYLRAIETIQAAGMDPEDFASAAAAQLGHVVAATSEIASEVVRRSYPRGPADLTEHAPVLERLAELRRGQRLGTGDLDRISALIRQRIDLGQGHQGLTSVLE